MTTPNGWGRTHTGGRGKASDDSALAPFLYELK